MTRGMEQGIIRTLDCDRQPLENDPSRLSPDISLILFYCYYFLYPWVYSSRVKSKNVEIKAGLTIGPERRR